MGTKSTSPTIDERLEDLSSLSLDDLDALEDEVQAAYTEADKADDLDTMEKFVVALESINTARTELEDKSDDTSDDKAADAKSEDEPKPEKKGEPEADKPVPAKAEAEAETPPEPEKPAEPEAAADDKKVEDTETAPVVEVATDKAETAEAKADTTDKAEEETPMAASGTDFSPPDDRRPVVASASDVDMKVLAGADIPNFSAGTEFHTVDEVSEAMSLRIDTIRDAVGGDGQKHVVASVRASLPEARMLGLDTDVNMPKIEKVTKGEEGTETGLIAAGGYCAPLPVRYEIFGLGSTARPVRDALPTFGATRGGVRFVTPPKLGDDAAAVGLWTPTADTNAATVQTVTNKALTSNVATLTTAAPHNYTVGQTVKVNINDPVFDGTYKITAVTATTFSYAKTNANVTSAATSGTAQMGKPLLKVACAAEATATADAVTLQLQFGNLMSRAFPELVTRHNQLALIEHARFAERELLAKIAAQSVAVTQAKALGTARDFLLGLGRATAGYRNRHRLDRRTTLRVIAPDWVRDAMREDLAVQLPGDDKLAVADAIIDNYISARNVRVSWHMDADLGAQGAGALGDFPATVVWYLFAEGTFLFLDGGTLDLGVVRDSGLVATNDYITFVETFEGIAKVGIEALQITTTTDVTGATVGTIAPSGAVAP